MSGGFTKLFADIVESSIWSEPPDVCKIWITLLALADRDGYIRGSSGWLADKARVSKEICDHAIQKFSSPDPTSRTMDNEGRRIELLPDGWLILNYLRFRDRLSDAPSAISSRERVRRHRERYKALRNVTSVTSKNPVSASVSVSDFETKEGGGGETKDLDRSPILPAQPEDRFEVPVALRTPDFLKVWDKWLEYKAGGRHSRKTDVMFREQLLECQKHGKAESIECITRAIAKGWKGIFYENNGKKFEHIQLRKEVRR